MDAFYDYLTNSAILVLAYATPGLVIWFVVTQIIRNKLKSVASESDHLRLKKHLGTARLILGIWFFGAVFLGMYSPSHTPKRTIDVTAQEKQAAAHYKAEISKKLESTAELKDRLRKNKETNEEREERFQEMTEY